MLIKQQLQVLPTWSGSKWQAHIKVSLFFLATTCSRFGKVCGQNTMAPWTSYSPSLFVVYNNYISTSLESNRLQFGVTIDSIIVCKQTLRISTSCHVYNKISEANPSRSISFLQRGDSWYFPVSIGVGATFPSGRVSRNCGIIPGRDAS